MDGGFGGGGAGEEFAGGILKTHLLLPTLHLTYLSKTELFLLHTHRMLTRYQLTHRLTFPLPPHPPLHLLTTFPKTLHMQPKQKVREKPFPTPITCRPPLMLCLEVEVQVPNTLEQYTASIALGKKLGSHV